MRIYNILSDSLASMDDLLLGINTCLFGINEQ